MAELRAKKSGIGADIEKKLEARYDQEHEAGTTGSIMCWVNVIVKEDKIEGDGHRDLHLAFRNGVKLCKLINALLESDGKPKISFNATATQVFKAYANIEKYNEGCLQYGLAKEFLVQSADVWEGPKGRFLNVINNLHSLACLANQKGYGITYTGNIEKKIEF